MQLCMLHKSIHISEDMNTIYVDKYSKKVNKKSTKKLKMHKIDWTAGELNEPA